MSRTARLYDEDFVRWTQEQAAELRKAAQHGLDLPLDWDNLAEEVESLGRSERRELRSRIGTIIEHLLKLECSLKSGPHAGWRSTIRRERSEIEALLEDSPSLKGHLPQLVKDEGPKAAKRVAADFYDRGELDPAVHAKLKGVSYSVEEIVGDDFFPKSPSESQG